MGDEGLGRGQEVGTRSTPEEDQHLMLERGLEDKLRENKPRSAELLLSTPVEAHSGPWR